MDVVITIIFFIIFFVLASYLVGSFVQLLSNWTGKHINIRTSFGWTSFKPKTYDIKIQQELEFFNRQMEAANLGMSAFDEQLYTTTGDKEILKEYELLPQTLRIQIKTAIKTHPILEEKEPIKPFSTVSFWQTSYMVLYYKLQNIDYENFKTFFIDEKEEIKTFINHYLSENRKFEQFKEDKLMLEIDVKKMNDEISLILLPDNPMIAQIDIAFKDICLFLKNYPDKDKLIDVKSNGNFNIAVYSTPVEDFKLENYNRSKPSNYVTLTCKDINFDEIKRTVKFAYQQMPQNFKTSFLYNIDFDSLTY